MDYLAMQVILTFLPLLDNRKDVAGTAIDLIKFKILVGERWERSGNYKLNGHLLMLVLVLIRATNYVDS